MLGTVTPIASVAIKARLETVITQVHFEDGAQVKRGDLLFTLDSRHIEAEMKKVEALLAGAQAQLQQAERDVARYTELSPRTRPRWSRTTTRRPRSSCFGQWSSRTSRARESQVSARSHQDPRADLRAHQRSQASVGNFVRPSDTAPLATIVYMVLRSTSAFTVPQRNLADLQQALAAGTATIDVTVPGASKPAAGQVTMVDHTVDSATGMVTVRATMPNADNVLWPGMLVSARLTLAQ